MWVWAALVAFGVVLVALVGGTATFVVIALSVVGLVLLTLGRPVGLLGRRVGNPSGDEPSVSDASDPRLPL
jgi:UDP-GlcNAc:undecaprenyl-phosphate GlcNAc-1-phosphate transferase